MVASIWNPASTVPADSDADVMGFDVTEPYRERTVGYALQTRSISVRDFPFNAAGDGVTDDRAAFQAAIDYLVTLGGGELLVPTGNYLINGVASGDTYKHGILLPDTNGDFDTEGGITIRGFGTSSRLIAGSSQMIVIRGSRLYTRIKNLYITGSSLADTIGVALAAEDLDQTTELVSQSFQILSECFIEYCTEGLYLRPGPTVTGADSGGFYHRIRDCVFNLNTRHVWMRPDVTAANNRTTRTLFEGCIFLRGNTGVGIDEGTEIDFVGCHWELITSGTSPSATPTSLYYNTTNPAQIRIIGGAAEACSQGITSNAPHQVLLIGYSESMAPSATHASMGKHITGRLVIAKETNLLASLAFGNAGYVGFVADPDQTGAKTLDLEINGTKLWRFDATRLTRFYGSLGNVEFGAGGNLINFTRPGNSSIASSAGGLSFSSQSVNLYSGLSHEFYDVAIGTKWATIDATGLDLLGDTVRIRTTKTPASAAATGSTGQIAWDSNYIYVCVAANTWKRVAIATW